jgi:hypothetical protein
MLEIKNQTSEKRTATTYKPTAFEPSNNFRKIWSALIYILVAIDEMVKGQELTKKTLIIFLSIFQFDIFPTYLL